MMRTSVDVVAVGWVPSLPLLRVLTVILVTGWMRGSDSRRRKWDIYLKGSKSIT